MPPDSHKEIARFLKDITESEASVVVYRDNDNSRPIPIGQFGKELYSTIGSFEMNLCLPAGQFELAAAGKLQWLPNALCSSIYWLSERESTEWPLLCEDVVRDNAKSTYRHMAYAPSPFRLKLTAGPLIQWLLGIPVTDNDILITEQAALDRAKNIYPDWLFGAGA